METQGEKMEHPHERPGKAEENQKNEFLEVLSQKLPCTTHNIGDLIIKKHIVRPGIQDICEKMDPFRFKIRIRFKQLDPLTGKRIDKSRDARAEVNVVLGKAQNIPWGFHLLLTLMNLEEEAWFEYTSKEFLTKEGKQETKEVSLVAWIKIIEVSPALAVFQNSLEDAQWTIQTMRKEASYKFKKLKAFDSALKIYTQAFNMLVSVRKFAPVEETMAWRDKEMGGLSLNIAICSHKADAKNITKAMEFIEKAESLGGADKDKIVFWKAEFLARQEKGQMALEAIRERLESPECQMKKELRDKMAEIERKMGVPKAKKEKKGFLEFYTKELDKEEIKRRQEKEKEINEKKKAEENKKQENSENE